MLFLPQLRTRRYGHYLSWMPDFWSMPIGGFPPEGVHQQLYHSDPLDARTDVWPFSEGGKYPAAGHVAEIL